MSSVSSLKKTALPLSPYAAAEGEAALAGGLKRSVFKTFDPRVKFDNEADRAAAASVWTSSSVELARNAVKNAEKLLRTPFFENNPDIRKGNLVFRPNDDEIREYTKCMISLMYFAEEWCKLKGAGGEIGFIDLRDYQADQLKKFLKDDRHIMLWSRQAAKTTTTCLFILWSMTFKNDKLTAILGNNGRTSAEVLRKIKEIYVNLPFFLQAGVLGWNGGAVAFDNGCVMLSRPCTFDALNGLSVYILYIDEFAFCFGGVKEKQREFLANAAPVLSSFKDSKLIITSTPNGKDLFCEMFDLAVKKKSPFIPTKVYWWQIPGRDEAWAKRQVGEIGEEKFKIQYELSFDVTLDKLLDAATMKRLDDRKLKFVQAKTHFDHECFENNATSSRIHPSLSHDIVQEHAFVTPEDKLKQDARNTFNKEKDFIVTTADLAEGLGGDSDFTTLHAFKLGHTLHDGTALIDFEQMLVFEDNTMSLDAFSKYTCQLHSTVFKQDNTRYLFEANKYGDFHRLQMLNIGDEDYDLELWPETLFKFKRSVDSNKTSVGLLTNRAIKPLAVKAFTKAIKNDLFIIHDETTIEQINNFQKDAKGNYKAEVGHDDLVTPIVNMAWLVALNPMALTEVIEDYLTSRGLNTEKWKFKTDLYDSDSAYMKSMGQID